MLEKLNKKSFEEHLNTTFTISNSTVGEMEVELVHVAEKQLKGQENFSVEFKGPEDKPMDQGIQDFKHDKMGEFSLFIVPVERVEGGILYQAVFCRPLEK